MSSVPQATHLFFNGEVLPVETPLFSGTELAVLRGYAVFDFFRVESGVPLFFDLYMDRFFRSAEIMGLSVPLEREEIAEALQRLLRANAVSHGRARLVLTGGSSPDGMSPGRENLLILLHPPLDQTAEPEGIRVLTQRHLREFPEAKTTNYLTAVQGLPRMREAGASELLYHDGALLLEAARANVFLVTPRGVLVTPKERILGGITRSRVLTVIGADPQAAGIVAVEERNVALAELAEAREVFLTGSGRLVTPVASIDGEPVGDGGVGPASRNILSLLREDSRAYVDTTRMDAKS